jgi:hypothetical protein
VTEFIAFPKIPRWRREVVVTEKIDGTNAGIQVVQTGEDCFSVVAQSRKRIITPDDDNFGFARWVQDNASAIVATLGAGVHFGEWWGSGIQRGYGLPQGEKRLSLFNSRRWADVDLSAVPGLDVVPTLYTGPLTEETVDGILDGLRRNGSAVAPFMNPEGVVVWHTASRQNYKILLDNDDVPKGLVNA